MDTREFLEQANGGEIKPQAFYQLFVENIATLFVLYFRSGGEKNPILSKGNRENSQFIVAFTDQAAAEQVRLQHKYRVELVEEPVLSFLIQAYRSENDGLLLNPGQASRFFLMKEYLLSLIAEYSVDQLSRMSGAWIPTMQDNMLLVEYEQGSYTIAVYVSKEYAQGMCDEAGGVPILHPWEAIFEQAQKVGAQSLYLHFHLPEQNVLSTLHIEKIWKGRHEGFQESKAKFHSYQVSLIEGTNSTEQPSQPSVAVEPQESVVQQQLVLSSASESVEAKESMEPPASKQDASQKIVEEAPESKRSSDDVNKQPQGDPAVTDNKKASHTERSTEAEETTPTVEESQAEEPEENKKSQFPSQRVNPYSIKNQQERDLDIYLGSDQEKNSSELSIPPSAVDQNIVNRSSERESSEKKEISTVSEAESSQAFKPPIASPSQQKTKSTSQNQPNKDVSPLVRQGLQRLEKATIEGQGMANGWEVCQVLAEIRRIWIIVDQDSNMVILAGQDRSPIVDFFTSDLHAQRLIDEAHQNKSDLPPMRPQLVSTKKLFRALAPRQPIVWINRGSKEAWTSVMGDTLPYVMQLMTQLKQEKI